MKGQTLKGTVVLEKLLRSRAKIKILEGGSRCFGGDQKVITESGSIPISKIKAEQRVLTYDQTTRKNEYRKVLECHLFKNTKKTYRVKLKNGKEIIATSDHKFFFEGGWISLKHLLSLWQKRYGKMEANTKI